MRSRLVQAIAGDSHRRRQRAAVGNGRSPARKRKLNEKMLRSSEAEMPMPPLGAGFSQRLNLGDKTMPGGFFLPRSRQKKSRLPRLGDSFQKITRYETMKLKM